MKQEARAEAAILMVVLIWGANFAFIKAAVLEIPPLAFAALRFTIATVVLATIVKHVEVIDERPSRMQLGGTVFIIGGLLVARTRR